MNKIQFFLKGSMLAKVIDYLFNDLIDKVEEFREYLDKSLASLIKNTSVSLLENKNIHAEKRGILWHSIKEYTLSLWGINISRGVWVSLWIWRILAYFIGAVLLFIAVLVIFSIAIAIVLGAIGLFAQAVILISTYWKIILSISLGVAAAAFLAYIMSKGMERYQYFPIWLVAVMTLLLLVLAFFLDPETGWMLIAMIVGIILTITALWYLSMVAVPGGGRRCKNKLVPMG